MVPASLLQEKGLGLRVVTGSGWEGSDFLVQWETWWRLRAHTENYFWSEWRGGSGEDFSGIGGFGSAPWTMVEVIQRPAHLCLDKSFSVSVLACNISCSRGPVVHSHSEQGLSSQSLLSFLSLPVCCHQEPQRTPHPRLWLSLLQNLSQDKASFQSKRGDWESKGLVIYLVKTKENTCSVHSFFFY